MWKKVKIVGIEKIEKCVAEFQISMHTILPYGKMKIKIYEDQEGSITGRTDIGVKRKFDGEVEYAVGYGKTVEEALEDTINWFLNMVREDYPIESYPEGLSEEDIEYVEFSDF